MQPNDWHKNTIKPCAVLCTSQRRPLVLDGVVSAMVWCHRYGVWRQSSQRTQYTPAPNLPLPAESH